jgi:threonylcarbamoyladenosine tRNA methylthiotransferase MtaB
VQSALDGGTKEIVLTGVHLGAWGVDQRPGRRLHDLISTLLVSTPVLRLRLSSLEPWDLDEGFFSLWEESSGNPAVSPRLCRHLHLPMQSGSSTVLKRMNRKTSPESFASLVKLARKAIPDVAITTDIITGFPGETEVEFNETLEFTRTMRFAGGHIFTYSARPGTAAAKMNDQVPHEVRKERSSILREILDNTAATYRRGFLGRIMPVLWEATDNFYEGGWHIEGFTDNALRVNITAKDTRWNQVDPVRLKMLDKDGIMGEIQNM